MKTLLLFTCLLLCGAAQADEIRTHKIKPHHTAQPSPGDGAATGDTLPQYDLSEVVITMRRTACFGHCPIYSVAIYGNGRVEFTGHGFVAQKGVHTDSIPHEEVIRLVEVFHMKDFFSMKDRYENKFLTDLPATITTFESGTMSKSVYNYYGAPADLRAIEAMIDKIARTYRWIEGVAEQ